MSDVRILWLTTAASFDGPGRVLSALLNHWPSGDRVTLCVLRTASPEFRNAVPSGLDIHELRALGRWDARAIVRFVALCREQRPDVIHTQLSRADWIGRPVARWIRTPVVSTIQNLHSRMYGAEYSWPLALGGAALDRLTLPFADRLIAVSGGVKADLERLGARTDRIRVIHNALDLDRRRHLASRAAVRARWGCADGDLVIGAVALLKAQKGIRFLIEAAHRVAEREPRARFVHIGGGPLLTEARRRIAAAGLSDRFQLVDRVPEPMTLLGGLDIFVLPSLWEGLPVALLEAMAAGLPCIGTQVSGIEDAIEPDVSGVLVPPADSSALAAAVLDLCGDPVRRRTLGGRARDRVGSRFGAVAMASAYRQVYAELCPRVRSITTEPGDA